MTINQCKLDCIRWQRMIFFYARRRKQTTGLVVGCLLILRPHYFFFFFLLFCFISTFVVSHVHHCFLHLLTKAHTTNDETILLEQEKPRGWHIVYIYIFVCECVCVKNFEGKGWQNKICE